MKSLKALEQKYKLINEAGAPVPTTAVPRAAQPAAATAAPAAQPSILTPEELKSLNAPGSPVQPSKIDAIAKDPEQLKAFEQNELPGIIDGLVASIAQTHPEALKELHDAAKANDVNKVNSILAKYAKLTPTASATGESAKLNSEGLADFWKGVKEFTSKVFNFFKENPKFGYGILGLMIAGPLGAAALPLLASAIEKGNWGSGDKDVTNNNAAINKEVTNPDTWTKLKEYFKSIPLIAGKKVKAASVGVIPDLSVAYSITLSPQEVKRIANGTPINLLSQGNDANEPQFQLTGGNTGSYKISVIKDGNLWPTAPVVGGATDISGTSPTTSTIKTNSIGQKINAKGQYLKNVNSSFNYSAGKVLKEYYRNSKPLPIETANKK